MFTLYRFIVALLFYLSLPFLLLLVMITGKHRRGLPQRFGYYPVPVEKSSPGTTVWMHAASVGEVRAAKPIIAELEKQLPDIRIILTTMTVHGRRIALSQLDASIPCYLAPLDVPFITARAIRRIQPDIYICIETELWPVLLDSLARRKVKLYMVNGRISEKSHRKYQRMRWLVGRVLQRFDRMAVISARDRSRYISLGADPRSISVEGNVKYDFFLPPDFNEVEKKYSELLKITDEEVLVAGSTHTGEERLLLDLYSEFAKERSTLFIIAPRHVERIPEIEKELHSRNIKYQLFSSIKSRGELRGEHILLVDTLGELASIYSVAHFVFCGGSLVKKGGHNLMEAAVWNKAVFYGPHIDDFHDAADLLDAGSCGFMVPTIAELNSRIRYYRNHLEDYQTACLQAGRIARAQQGSARRQVHFLLAGKAEKKHQHY
ncbi:glycosyltransferase N-terminal domain-containing protein [Desulfopila inferna]|uniref:glycosyltransferase N-terminal domain-containing protein n=1 Tax=Desulfopila inferna TaxID=468528 RepID=UPI00196330B1|nr:hypothetical protein [Desulfopila inferna]